MISTVLREKWRPSLGLIVFAVLAFVMVLPLIGLFFFRLYDNQLIRQTQAELIAQVGGVCARGRSAAGKRHRAGRRDRSRAAA
jgi:hypothetical protein